MEPFKLIPSLKNYIWGGDKLIHSYNKKSDNPIIAESWELSCHPNGESIIAEGEFMGRKLSQVLRENSHMVGKNFAWDGDFPILVKLIDAAQNLSIQIHPNDEFAQREEHCGRGKTEMWYVVEAEPDAYIYCGFNRQITPEDLDVLLQNGRIEEALAKIPVQKGTAVLIESGTVHAICKGVLIAEVQQNSDITYRLFDYNRLDSQGNKRELHLEKGKKSIDYNIKDNIIDIQWQYKDGYDLGTLVMNKYFSTQILKINSKATLYVKEDTFHSLISLSGNFMLKYGERTYNVNKGDSYFIPAGQGTVELIGQGEVLITFLPEIN